MSLHRSDIQGEDWNDLLICPKCSSFMSYESFDKIARDKSISVNWKQCTNKKCKHKIYEFANGLSLVYSKGEN